MQPGYFACALASVGSVKDVAVHADLAVRWLVARAAQLVDDRDFDAALHLFADDGLVIQGGERHAGRQAIRSWLEARPSPALHQVTNLVVSNGSHDGVLHAVSDFVVLRPADGEWRVSGVGRYHDTLAGIGREVHFTQRIVTLR